MALKALDPAPKVPLTDIWEIHATEAGRTPDGLRATVQLWNGQIQACETITLGNTDARDRFAAAITPKIGLTTSVEAGEAGVTSSNFNFGSKINSIED